MNITIGLFAFLYSSVLDFFSHKTQFCQCQPTDDHVEIHGDAIY